MKQRGLVTLIACVLLSCNQKKLSSERIADTPVTETSIKQDTASLRKLLEKSQKPGADIAEMLFNEDTLKIATPLPNLYYPFGRHNHIKDIEKAITNYTVKSIFLKDPYAQDSTLVTEITTPKSIIKFLYDEEEGVQQIVSADIRDSNFYFLNNIQIGMSKKELLGVLFSKTPAIPVNNIKLISVLLGMNHYYKFKDDKLIEIKMITDYTLTGK